MGHFIFKMITTLGSSLVTVVRVNNGYVNFGQICKKYEHAQVMQE